MKTCARAFSSSFWNSFLKDQLIFGSFFRSIESIPLQYILSTTHTNHDDHPPPSFSKWKTTHFILFSLINAIANQQTHTQVNLYAILFVWNWLIDFNSDSSTKSFCVTAFLLLLALAFPDSCTCLSLPSVHLLRVSSLCWAYFVFKTTFDQHSIGLNLNDWQSINRLIDRKWLITQVKVLLSYLLSSSYLLFSIAFTGHHQHSQQTLTRRLLLLSIRTDISIPLFSQFSCTLLISVVWTYR